LKEETVHLFVCLQNRYQNSIIWMTQAGETSRPVHQGRLYLVGEEKVIGILKAGKEEMPTTLTE
jgi:hypothetical protein